jgi:DNA-binding transcriptional LysR family regulator
MELRVLKYFLMVAREENITKAAQLLHVTQPTLSRQLMQLEEELGGAAISPRKIQCHSDR